MSATRVSAGGTVSVGTVFGGTVFAGPLSFARLSLVLVPLALLVGCGGGSKVGPGALPAGVAELSCDQLFVRGAEQVDRGKNANGRQLLRRYEQRCPREPRIEEAKLRICRSFLQESTPELKAEGLAVCRQILTFYPNHSAACSAQFEIANYHFTQMRSCERDQAETVHAVEELQKLIASYPQCELVGQAQTKLAEAYGRLACAEMKVAEFYMKVKDTAAALHRLEDLLRKFPDFPEKCRARQMQINLLAKRGQHDEARTQFARMSEECAGTKELASAREKLVVAPSIK